ncbi:MAG: ParB/RepB/Spo0J family partition protein [Anaerolineae bacterium]
MAKTRTERSRSKPDLKSLVSGVLEAGEAAQSREVERHMGEMAPAPVASTVLKLPLDRIYPDPDQPRRTFPEESLEELAASIREQGVLEPIQVIATDQGYQLLHGERRWRAARLAGLSWIPSIIYEQPLSDADRLTRQLIENIQREDLNDVDRAAALERLKDLLNATWDEVAEKVGITKGRIHQLRRLSRLAPDIQEAVKAGELSEKDTRPYQGLAEEQQLALHQARTAESLSPGEVREAARRLKAGVDVPQAIQQIREEQERARQALLQPPVPQPPAPPVIPPLTPPVETPPVERIVPSEVEGVVVTPRPELYPEHRAEPVTPIPEEREPYADVETDRLLAHLEHVVNDVGQQLNLMLEALRRRPLASWEQERIETALSQFQETLIALQTEDEGDSPDQE